LSRLLALLLVTLAIPAASPAAGGELPLDQQIGQLLVMSFSGTAAPPYVLDALRERRTAGVILFRGNVESPRQLRTLTRRLRQAGGDPVIAIDQEGGDVRILPWAPPASSAPAQAAAGTVGRDARRAGLALRRAGISVSLAPVADVPSVPGAALAGRSFSARPARASTAAAAAVARLARGRDRSDRALPGLRARRSTPTMLL
jgi:beta-N-acetylhexosaminidase